VMGPGLNRHVGVYLGSGLVIHALEGHGVIVDDLTSLKFRGYSNLRFFAPR
jgi:cell wall-associated NlpC family hydrolase